MRVSSRALLVAAALICVPTVSIAQDITPTGVTVSSTYFSYDAQNLIDDSGLSGGVHDGNYDNMWMSDSGDTTPWLVFDLGSVQTLAEAHIWQYNYDECCRERGVNGLRILLSTNNVDYTLVTTTTLPQSPGGNIPATIVPVVGSARYVRFEVTSNHGDATWTGLSEVKFSSTVTGAAVPALSRWSAAGFVVLLLAAGLLAVRRLH